MVETPGGKQTPGSKASKKLNDSKFGETIVEEVQVSMTVMLNGVALVDMGYDKELRDALQAAMYEMADAWGCINTYLPQHVTRKRILDFQGETWTDKQETERPNKNYKRAPGWSNVQYQIRGYIVHPNDLAKIMDQVVKKIPGFSHEVNYFLRRETETGTFDEATTLGDIDNLEFQMVLPAAPDEAAGKRKLADLESRLKKAEEALAEARAAKKPAPAAAGAARRGVGG